LDQRTASSTGADGFNEAAISNSKNHSATLKYQCTDIFFFIVGSTGVDGTFAQTLLQLLILHRCLLSIAPV
jgi:hypothetical protein